MNCSTPSFPVLPELLELLLLLSHFTVSDSVPPHRWLPTSLPIPGILQARTLEWVAISFSSAWKWKVKVKPLSCVRLLATPWTAAHQAPPSMGFPRQEYWTGVPLPSPAHVNWVSDAIHPSHPLSSPSPPTFNLSQHQGLFQWVSSLRQVAKVLELQSVQCIFRVDFL